MPSSDPPARATELPFDDPHAYLSRLTTGRIAGGAFSNNTERALRADLAVYADWCVRCGLTALPAAADTVGAFVDAMAVVRAPATVRRYVASIAVANRAMGRIGTALEMPVQLAMKRMHRRRGRRQRQALGMTLKLRQKLLAAAGERLIDDRNRALISVAYDAMLRRSELTQLTVDDLAVDAHGSATVLVRRAKTDPEGFGSALYLAPDTVELLLRWLKRGGITEGRLFRSVTKDSGLGEALDPSQIPRILKSMARAADLAPEVSESLSGHSARIGAAQDMIASGIDMAAILHAGRWRSPAMLNRYGERLLARHSGAAQLARSQGRV